MDRGQGTGSSKRSGLWLILAIGAGVILALLLLQVPIARVGQGNGKVTVWQGIQAFRHLSAECQIDWAATYLFAGADAGGVGFLTILSQVPQRGPVEGSQFAWEAAVKDWNRFIARGTAEMEHGLKNVNPMCPLQFSPD